MNKKDAVEYIKSYGSIKIMEHYEGNEYHLIASTDPMASAEDNIELDDDVCPMDVAAEAYILLRR